MAELIYKKSALNALSNASYGNFNYVTARNAIDCVSTTTEAEIRAKAIDEAVEEMKRWICVTYGLSDIDLKEIDEIAKQLKEE